jgi:proliferating cell nuclear antigen PCNA
MNITIKNSEKADKFAYIFQNMKLFTEQINILFEEKRVYIQAMDTARVSIFEVEIDSTWFDVYTKTNNANICLGLNSTLFFKILNTRDKSQEVNILFNTEDSDQLEIHFHSENKAIFDKYFVIPLMNIEEELLAIPENDTQAEISINAANFANIISQLKMFGDTLDISCSEEKILFCSNSIESGKMTVEINIDDIDEFSINEGETVNLSFSLAHLNNICTYHKISKDVEIKWINEYPMQIIYKIDNSLVKLQFYLAPKFNED